VYCAYDERATRDKYASIILVFMKRVPPLESVVISPEGGVLGFAPEDRFYLSRGVDKNEMAIGGDFTVDLVAPWNCVYNISRHPSQDAAQAAYHDCRVKVNSGEYKIRIKSPAYAEIIPK
jgi:hypothetical protein